MQSDLPDSIHSGDEELVWRVKSDFMYFTQVTQVTFIRGTRPVASWQQFGLWDSLHLPCRYALMCTIDSLRDSRHLINCF